MARIGCPPFPLGAKVVSNFFTVPYRDAFPDADVHYEVGAFRIAQRIVLKSKPQQVLLSTAGFANPDANSHFALVEEVKLSPGAMLLDAAGLPVTLPHTTSSALQVSIPGVTERIVIGQPVAWDAMGEARIHGRLRVAETAGGILEISTLIPMEWLADPERVFPVTIDPDLILQPATGVGKDAMMRSTAPTSNFGTDQYLLDSISSVIYKGAIEFDLSAIPPGSLVQLGSLNIYSPGGVGPTPMNANLILASWQELLITWATTPPTMLTPEDSLSGGFGGIFQAFELTPSMQSMIDGVSPNYGWLISNGQGPPNAWYSNDHSGVTLHPYVRVIYTLGDIKIRDITAADDVVFPGQSGYAVTMTVENLGGRMVTIDSASLTFTGTADRTAEYTVTPDPLNPQAIAGRRSAVLDFNVAVSPGATREVIVIDGVVSVTDSLTATVFMDTGSDLNDVWFVSGPLGPTCSLGGPSGTASGNVILNLTPQSMAAPTVDALFEYSLDLGATWQACTPALGSPLGNPATGVAVGSPSSFAWNTVADSVGLAIAQPQVQVRATVDDSVSVSLGFCTTSTFAVDNTPPAPSCSLMGPSGLVAANITVTLVASSPASPTVTAVFGYSLDMGITWLPCTPAPGSPLLNPASGVPISTPRNFIWNSAADGVGVVLPAAAVIVRAVIDDLVSIVQGTCLTGAFAIDNVPPLPTCMMFAPSGTVSGDILVGVTPNSMSSPTANVLLQFSRNLGITFAPCTMAPASPATNPAIGVPVTVPVSFRWNSFADGVGVIAPETQILLRATVDDGISTVPGVCLSGFFAVDNVPPVPTCTLVGPAGTTIGNMALILNAMSASSPTVTAVFEYSLNGGATWLNCTAAPGSPLANPATGVLAGPQTFSWNTQADGVGLTSIALALVRATVDDGVSAVDGTCSDGPQTVDNTAIVPTCTITGPSGIEVRDVDTLFTAMSTQVAIVDVMFEYSQNGGVSFSPCTADATSPLQNPAIAVAVGAPMSFIWDSLSDGVGVTAVAPLVVLRALVDDRQIPLLGFCSTVTFAIDNSGAPCGFCGDCDENGSFVTIIDSLFGAQIAAGTVTPSLIQTCVCDVDSSGTITVLDSLLLAQEAAGIAISLNCPSGGGGGGTPPSITLRTPPAAVDPIGCPFDVTGVPLVDLSFHYSTNGGASWQLASPHPSSPLTNPDAGVASGVGLVFIWHSAADVPNPSRPATALLRVTAVDPLTSASDQEVRSAIALNPSAAAAGSGTCADPYIVVPGLSMPGSTVARGEDSFPNCAFFSTAEDVTYSLTFTGTRNVTIDCLNPSYGAAIYVQTICGDNLSEIGCNEVPPNPRIVLPALTGGTYYIWVDGVGATEGTFNLLVTVN